VKKRGQYALLKVNNDIFAFTWTLMLFQWNLGNYYSKDVSHGCETLNQIEVPPNLSNNSLYTPYSDHIL
jgi:hypothetical protein